MKKAFLLIESTTSFIYTLLLITMAIANNEGRFFALIMLFFLGVWQYGSALIWVICGDSRRRTYFLFASSYLLLSLISVYGKFGKRFEVLVYGAFITIPISLAIWYQIIAHRHYQSLENEDKVLEDENGASQLL